MMPLVVVAYLLAGACLWQAARAQAWLAEVPVRAAAARTGFYGGVAVGFAAAWLAGGRWGWWHVAPPLIACVAWLGAKMSADTVT